VPGRGTSRSGRIQRAMQRNPSLLSGFSRKLLNSNLTGRSF